MGILKIWRQMAFCGDTVKKRGRVPSELVQKPKVFGQKRLGLLAPRAVKAALAKP